MSDIFNQSELLANTGGNAGLCAELVEAFIEEYPKLMLEARQAVAGHDAVALARTAHSLKGVVANFVARPALDAARAIELISHNGNLRDAEEAYTKLAFEIARLHQALQEFVKTVQDPQDAR
ncbi:MAG TPA: Hpt domain-containing protein [Blastocatellia bacterium]